MELSPFPLAHTESPWVWELQPPIPATLGYGLIGQATRTCVVAHGGTTGTWSGSQPTCEGTTNLK